MIQYGLPLLQCGVHYCWHSVGLLVVWCSVGLPVWYSVGFHWYSGGPSSLVQCGVSSMVLCGPPVVWYSVQFPLVCYNEGPSSLVQCGATSSLVQCEAPSMVQCWLPLILCGASNSPTVWGLQYVTVWASTGTVWGFQ